MRIPSTPPSGPPPGSSGPSPQQRKAMANAIGEEIAAINRELNNANGKPTAEQRQQLENRLQSLINVARLEGFGSDTMNSLEDALSYAKKADHYANEGKTSYESRAYDNMFASLSTAKMYASGQG